MSIQDYKELTGYNCKCDLGYSTLIPKMRLLWIYDRLVSMFLNYSHGQCRLFSKENFLKYVKDPGHNPLRDFMDDNDLGLGEEMDQQVRKSVAS